MAKARKKNKRVRKHSFFLGLALAAFIGFLVYSSLSAVLQISDYNDKIAAAQRELSAQRSENNELATYLKTASEDEIIIRIAREKLGYVMPNERIFYDAG